MIDDGQMGGGRLKESKGVHRKIASAQIKATTTIHRDGGTRKRQAGLDMRGW